MKTLVKFLKAKGDFSEDRSQFIFVSNVLSLVFALLTFFLAFILYIMFGWGPTMSMIIGLGFLYFVIILLNKTGWNNAGRLLFCLAPVVFTMVVTLYGKVVQPGQSYIVYFDSRFVLLISTVLPAIVFEFTEKVKLVTCLLASFCALILFDPIHNAFGVGYYQMGHAVKSYYYINYIAFISFVGLLSAILVLKWRDQVASNRLRDVIGEKQKVNMELKNQNNELEVLTEEMKQQQEELQTNHEMLENANILIEEQQQKLQTYNFELESLVVEKSAELIKANEELIKSNNELRQFSFTVSHNLRGPVARLLGLTNLVKLSKDEQEITQLTEFINQSASELDSILHDLSQIIDIRNELYGVREKIVVQEEWDRAVVLVGQSTEGVAIHVNFEKSPYVFGIRAMVQSIFYNLLSNAIKYKSPHRNHVIEVSSYSPSTDRTIFEIRDNGLGMDIKTQRDNLFKLYKRFHHHVAGKGMGLYLVKSQMEIMRGQVEVESEPDQGTVFRLTFPVPEDVGKQVFYENDSAQLYYDAHINNTVIIWKRNVTGSEYRKAFEVVLQTMKTYNTPGWIADLRNQGVIEPEDQQWFISNVLQVAAENGLVRIATIGFTDPIRKDYYDRMKTITSERGIELRVFESVEVAVNWMLSFASVGAR